VVVGIFCYYFHSWWCRKPRPPLSVEDTYVIS
jgi:hypothetical protein